jgi:FAD/FMN-containing dehydrogenase
MITVSKVFSSVPPLFSKLASIVAGDIDCSHLALTAHSYDGSPYSVRPQAVLYPKTSNDIKHAISFAREYGIPLTVCGGQSASSGGALGEGVVLDMTRYFSKIRHVNMLDHTVTVDAGVSIDSLIEQLEGWHMQIPVLHKEHGKATIGGLVATKSATASTFHAGTIREWIEGLTVIVDSGEEHTIRDGITPSGRLLGIYQSVFPLLIEHGPTLRAERREASDDATGYAVWNTSIGPRQLLDELVGSEGTLAVITSVTLRVIPNASGSYASLLPIAGTQELSVCANVARHHGATSLFMFDHAFRSFCDTFYPLTLPTDLPESPFYLLITMEGKDEHAAQEKMKAFAKTLPHAGETYELREDAKEKIVTQSFLKSLFDRYSKGTHMVATAGQGIIVSLHRYAECIEAIDDFLGKTGRPYALTGYPGSGHVAVHASFDAQSVHYEEDLQVFRNGLFQIVSSFGGGISAVGGDGLERTASFPFVFNEATLKVFRELKSCWDPESIFNPSKKIALSEDYLVRHTTRTFL